MQSFIKKPLESYPITLEYKERLPLGSVLSSGAVSAIDMASNTDQTATVLVSPTAAISGTQATFSVRGGTSGHSYRITVLATLSNGGPLQDEISMVVDV